MSRIDPSDQAVLNERAASASLAELVGSVSLRLPP